MEIRRGGGGWVRLESGGNEMMKMNTRKYRKYRKKREHRKRVKEARLKGYECIECSMCRGLGKLFHLILLRLKLFR